MWVVVVLPSVPVMPATSSRRAGRPSRVAASSASAGRVSATRIRGVWGGTGTDRITASAAPWAAAVVANSWPSLCRPWTATKRSPGPARRES